jgi:hypothetical protein
LAGIFFLPLALIHGTQPGHQLLFVSMGWRRIPPDRDVRVVGPLLVFAGSGRLTALAPLPVLV